jgi:hypothetical protein
MKLVSNHIYTLKISWNICEIRSVLYGIEAQPITEHRELKAVRTQAGTEFLSC